MGILSKILSEIRTLGGKVLLKYKGNGNWIFPTGHICHPFDDTKVLAIYGNAFNNKHEISDYLEKKGIPFQTNYVSFMVSNYKNYFNLEKPKINEIKTFGNREVLKYMGGDTWYFPTGNTVELSYHHPLKKPKLLIGYDNFEEKDIAIEYLSKRKIPFYDAAWNLVVSDYEKYFTLEKPKISEIQVVKRLDSFEDNFKMVKTYIQRYLPEAEVKSKTGSKADSDRIIVSYRYDNIFVFSFDKPGWILYYNRSKNNWIKNKGNNGVIGKNLTFQECFKLFKEVLKDKYSQINEIKVKGSNDYKSNIDRLFQDIKKKFPNAEMDEGGGEHYFSVRIKNPTPIGYNWSIIIHYYDDKTYALYKNDGWNLIWGGDKNFNKIYSKALEYLKEQI